MWSNDVCCHSLPLAVHDENYERNFYGEEVME